MNNMNNRERESSTSTSTTTPYSIGLPLNLVFCGGDCCDVLFIVFRVFLGTESFFC